MRDDRHRNLETAGERQYRSRSMDADRRGARGKPLAVGDRVHDRNFGALDCQFGRTLMPRDHGPRGRLLRDDPDLSCARNLCRLHIVHRDEPNDDLPQAGCPLLLQQWPLCIETAAL
jgi:hypothetical protein